MAAIDEQVAIAYAGVELEILELEVIGKIGNEPLGLGVGDSAGGVIFHYSVDDGDEIAAEDPIGGRKGNSLGGGLEGSAASVINFGVIPQQAHGCDIAAAFETFGDGAHEADAAIFGNAIHVGGVRGFKRGFAAEFFEGIVGGAVGDDDGVFHQEMFKDWSQDRIG